METAAVDGLRSRSKEIQDRLGNSDDLKFRFFQMPTSRLRGFMVYIDGIVDARTLQEHILEPLLMADIIMTDEEQFVDELTASVLQACEVQVLHSLDDAVAKILEGYTVIAIEDVNAVFAVNTAKWNERAVGRPDGQRTVKGPDMGFTESLSGNVAILRKIMKHPGLRVETDVYGTMTQTSISLVYLESMVNKTVLKNVKDKLKELSLKSVLAGNYIEEGLTKDTKSIFPLLLNTDRPDVVSAQLLEGRVGIVVDGTPYVLMAPAVLIQFFQSADDYYLPYQTISILRPLRVALYTLSLLIPSLYVAFTTYHPGLLPVKFMVGLVTQRESVPFPTVLEVLLSLVLVEAIIEGSNRLPKNMSFAVSIFGAIVFGQAAVEAQLVQPITLVVLSLSFVLTSLIPIVTFSYATRVLKWLYIFVGAFMGFYGILLFGLLLMVHLCYLRSFGVPYLSPVAPFQPADQKDTFVRMSIPKINRSKPRFHEEEPMEAEPASYEDKENEG